MKQFPLLMKPEMVRQTLALNKTMTRRIITAYNSIVVPKVPWCDIDLSRAVVDQGPLPVGNPGPYLYAPNSFIESDRNPQVRIYPRWEIGDRFYVKETWAPTHATGGHEYPDDWCWFEWEEDYHGKLEPGARDMYLYYRADGEDNLPAEFSMPSGSEIRWRPSIYMPRWASRLTLEITRMRAERVQDITNEDAISEGVSGATEMREQRLSIAQHLFADLWDSINAKKGHGWDVNDWVWIPDFKIVEDQ